MLVTHWLTHWLTHCCLVNLMFCLIDVKWGLWRCQLKTFWGCYCRWCWWEKHFDDSFMQIWKLKFGHKANFFFIHSAQGLVKSLKLKFKRNFDVWSKCWGFGWDFEFWNLIKICVRTCYFGKQNSTLGSVTPLAMFWNGHFLIFITLNF